MEDLLWDVGHPSRVGDVDDLLWGLAPCRSPMQGGFELDDLLADLETSRRPASASSAAAHGPEQPCTRQEDPLDDLLGELRRPLLERRDRFARAGLRPEDRTPSPSRDRRGPVVDDYEVVDAIAAFERRRSGDPVSSRIHDLTQAIRWRESQVHRLSAVADERRLESSICEHYRRIRKELMQEIEGLAAELAGLATADTSTPSPLEGTTA
eukprot:TRINITY_DN4187_c0_g1_i1.p1 TRINITY_DN4187_c0_g1~~TRINITY_DN4187_c0_g1_i1.p1  ORF type:complete len:238 (+),score=28.23 TRINITY_DN4187_c0_g1_i1:87-716(+)